MPSCFFCGDADAGALVAIALPPLRAEQQSWYTPPLPATILACVDLDACQARRARQIRDRCNPLAF